MDERLEPGMVLRLRKTHPCGSRLWKILRLGAEIEIECLGCGRRLLMEPLLLRKVATKVENS
ncbi:MAG: DUF951 domain-containing protein [Synergistales bacterium]|jgi:hypothetical protein|nr:DUF951 domain-containing protein [Synergistales bacterium]